MSKVIEITEATFDAEVLKSEKAVVVKFYRKEGCRQCAIMEPVFDAYAEKHDEIKCIAYACGQTRDKITAKYPFANFPAFIGFVNGEPIQEMAVKTLEGVMPESEIGGVLKTKEEIKEK